VLLDIIETQILGIIINISAQSKAAAWDVPSAQSNLQLIFNQLALQKGRKQGLKGLYTSREAIQILLPSRFNLHDYRR